MNPAEFTQLLRYYFALQSTCDVVVGRQHHRNRVVHVCSGLLRVPPALDKELHFMQAPNLTCHFVGENVNMQYVGS